MDTQTAYKLWSYDFTHYVPFTPKGGGDIQWTKVTEYREINIPSDVTDPVKYLQQCGIDNDTDLLEYSYFSVEE